jgi:hypothetical protein
VDFARSDVSEEYISLIFREETDSLFGTTFYYYHCFKLDDSFQPDDGGDTSLPKRRF